MKVFEGFAYQKGASVIHKLDPRSKIIYVICLSVLSTAVFYTLLPMFILFLINLPLVVVSKTTMKWLQVLKGASVFLVFIFLFNFLGMMWNYFPAIYSAPTNEVLSATSTSLAMALRFLALISVFAVFFLTTSPDDFAQSLIQMGLPYDYALTFTMAMRFVPMLARETQLIIDAQRSRGLELEKGSVVQKIKNYVPILIPLIISSFKRAEMIADAMESRAFGATKDRTYLHTLSFRRSDHAFIAISLLLFITALLLRFGGLLL